MKILSDNHTHTIYSKNNHAKGTIRENTVAAIKKNLIELNISDHGPGHIFYGIKRENFKKAREEVDEVNREFPEIKVTLGVEANVISYNGKIDLRKEELPYLDKISVGFHYGVRMRDLKGWFIFGLLNPISRKTGWFRDYIREETTKALILIVNNHPIDIITHPGSKIEVDILALAKACEMTNTALEINAYHGHMSVDEIKLALQTNVMFSIGSDAHSPKRVGDMEKAVRRAIEAGVPPHRIINRVDETLA